MASGGNLVLAGVAVDGASTIPVTAPLVTVKTGGTLNLSPGAVLKNNANSAPDGMGGAVLNEGEVILSGGSLVGNYATYGGAIYCKGTGELSMSSGVIGSTDPAKGNRAAQGGGVYLAAGSVATLSGGSVAGNMSTRDGGGIYAASTSASQAATLTVKYTVFESNTAGTGGQGGGGGAIFNAGRLTVERAQFGSPGAGNNAGQGGALYNESPLAARVDTAWFLGNDAREMGGAVYNNSELAILDTVFGDMDDPSQGNTALEGGAIANGQAGLLSLTDVSLYGNQATAGDGGGVCNLSEKGEKGCVVSRCDFNGNMAPHGSGGALFSAGLFKAEQSRFTGNAARYGGAICAEEGATLAECVLIQNVASEDGGGVFSRAALALARCSLEENTAEGMSGGGVFCTGAVTCTGALLAEKNKAGEDGGFICAESVSIGSAGQGNYALRGNTAGSGGGAIAADGAVQLEGNIQLQGNSAAEFGGAIASYGQVTLGKGVTLLENKTDGFGGGVCVVQMEEGDAAGLQVAGALKNNVAGMTGGGAALFSFLPGQTLSARFASGSTVQGNSAGTYGGGVYAMAMAKGNVEVNLAGGAALSGNKANKKPDALFFTASDAQVPDDDDWDEALALRSTAARALLAAVLAAGDPQPATATQSFLRLSGTPSVEGVITLAYKQSVRITGALTGASLQMAGYAVQEDPRTEATLIPFQRYDVVATGEGYTPTAADLAQFSLYQPANPAFILRLDGNNIIVDLNDSSSSDTSSSSSTTSGAPTSDSPASNGATAATAAAPGSPQTGDAASTAGWVLLGTLSLAGAATLTILRRRGAQRNGKGRRAN